MSSDCSEQGVKSVKSIAGEVQQNITSNTADEIRELISKYAMDKELKSILFDDNKRSHEKMRRLNADFAKWKLRHLSNGEDEDLNAMALDMQRNFKDKILKPSIERAVESKLKGVADLSYVIDHYECEREMERAKTGNMITKIQLEKDELEQFYNIEKTKNSILKNKLVKQSQQAKQRNLVLQAYKAWISEIEVKNSKLNRLKEAERIADQHLFTKAFQSWRSIAREKIIGKIKSEANKQLKDVTTKIVARYEDKLATMATELEEAKLAARNEARKVSKLENDLRLALLRGMSALNMEALGIFNDEKLKYDRKLAFTHVPCHQKSKVSPERRK